MSLLSSHSYTIDGLRITEHQCQVPLVHPTINYPLSVQKLNHFPETITLFAREIQLDSMSNSRESISDLNIVLYLNGGPGYESPLPVSASSGTMLGELLKLYDRVVYFDQRGTGKSDGISVDSLVSLGNEMEQMQYLLYFRADSIIEDAEILRTLIYGSTKKWTVLGQSFGGFCVVTYLSKYQNSLKNALITGGIPPIPQSNTSQHPSRSVYEQLLPKVVRQMNRFYHKFPEDEQILTRIGEELDTREYFTPAGNQLTFELFQTIGLRYLGSAHGFTALHFLLQRAFESDERLSFYFLSQIDTMIPFAMNPLYALLHEACYADGYGKTEWAAERAKKQNPLFESKERRYLCAEQVFPHHFENIKQLKAVRKAADLLARYEEWTKLYDVETLKHNTVPVVAFTYVNDLYVDFELSMKSADLIQGIQLLISNEFTHGAVRDAASVIIPKMHAVLYRTQDAPPLEAL